MSPVLPQDLRPLVINDNDPWCTAIRKLLKAAYLYYKWKKYQTKEDGLIADAWAADICNNTDCVTPVIPTS